MDKTIKVFAGSNRSGISKSVAGVWVDYVEGGDVDIEYRPFRKGYTSSAGRKWFVTRTGVRYGSLRTAVQAHVRVAQS